MHEGAALPQARRELVFACKKTNTCVTDANAIRRREGSFWADCHEGGTWMEVLPRMTAFFFFLPATSHSSPAPAASLLSSPAPHGAP